MLAALAVLAACSGPSYQGSGGAFLQALDTIGSAKPTWTGSTGILTPYPSGMPPR